MEQLISLDADILQSLLDCPESILNEDILWQIAVASHPDTPQKVLKIIASGDNPEVAESAQMHLNYGGELAGDIAIALVFILIVNLPIIPKLNELNAINNVSYRKSIFSWCGSRQRRILNRQGKTINYCC